MRRLAVALVPVALVVIACGGAPSLGAAVIDERPAPQSEAFPLTLEEAGLLASGSLADIYGARADPVPVHVADASVRYRGQRVWRLDVTVQVTLAAKRTERRWRLWVGTLADGRAGVVRAEQLS